MQTLKKCIKLISNLQRNKKTAQNPVFGWRVLPSKPFPTLYILDFQIVLELDVPRNVELPRLFRCCRNSYALVHFANIFRL